MATIRNQILDAIASKLNGAEKPAGLTVERFPVYNLEERSLPHVCVRPGREDVNRPSDKLRAYPVRERILSVRIECRVQVGLNESPDEALDPFVAWVTKALSEDPTFGKLATSTEEVGIEWESDEMDSRFGLATITFSVNYTTNASDQEKAR